jgi:hypothetical protein
MRAALAALMLAAAPAAAQVSDPDRFRDQTPEEIAAIIALNRVQIERGQAAAARQAEIFARAQAEAEAYRRELDHNQQLWFDYEIQAREQAEAYRRALQEQARIEAACRRGDTATCNRAWLERGLPLPAPAR